MTERLFRRSIRRLGFLGVALVVALPSCATSETPEGSSSSHWVHCKTDAECVEYAANCGADEYCVDSEGERISVDGPSPNTPNDDDTPVADDVSADDDEAPVPELVECDPLARWQRVVELEDPRVVARSAEGVVYAVTELDSGYLVWRSRGEALEPLRVVGSGEGGGELSLNVDDGADGFTLLVVAAGDAQEATLFSGEVERGEADPSLGEALEVLEEAALLEFDVLPLDVPARAEIRLGEALWIAGGLEVLLLRPDWGYGVEDFRLFYGTEGALSEVTVQDVLREPRPDGSTSVEFVLPTGEVSTLTYSTEGGGTLSPAPAGDPLLSKRSVTELALAALTFQCLEPVERRFQATGEPFEPPPMQCDAPPVRMGACISASSLVVGQLPEPLDVTGTLTATGVGMPPSDGLLANGETQGCQLGMAAPTVTFGDMYGSSSELPPDDELRWFHVEYEGGDSWVALHMPGLDVSLTEGTSVRLVQTSVYDFGGPIDSFIELRDANDELLLWLGQSYTLEELGIPSELTLQTGVETCALSDQCALDYGYYSVEASSNGSTASAMQGESVDLGDYRFTNSAYQIQTGAFVCTDSTAYFARFALWRR